MSERGGAYTSDILTRNVFGFSGMYGSTASLMLLCSKILFVVVRNVDM